MLTNNLDNQDNRIICPFCGGEMLWDSDYMVSNLGCCDLKYIKIKDEKTLNELKENYNKLVESGTVFPVKDVSSYNKEIGESHEYQYIYIENNGELYEIDDAIVSVYHCMKCGKSYEVTDCFPSEKENYLYYTYNNEQDNQVL